MRILHYTLGLPPQRSGGLTRYSVSLMRSQVEQGDEVSLLYPSPLLCNRKTSEIEKLRQVDSIKCYRLKTTSIIPLLHGVKAPSDILHSSDLLTQSIESFIEEVNPDVFHIHTWMGISLNLLKYIAKKSIKIVYTTHDYFGLCLKVNFINCDGVPCVESIRDCATCNAYALNKVSLYLRNNDLLLSLLKRFVTLSTFVKRKIVPIRQQKIVERGISADYDCLYSYYEDLFKLVDRVHYNSFHTEKIYRSILPDLKGKVISITHDGIVDLRRKIYFSSDQPLNMLYIGSEEPYKGLPKLINGLRTLDANKNWMLHIYGNSSSPQTQSSQFIYHGFYSSEESDDVFRDKHLLIIPSIWNETFGFVALEAISRGIPVLVSDTVGAKDIVGRYAPNFICSNVGEIISRISDVLQNRELLSAYNQKIIDAPFDYLMSKHVSEIKEFYNSIV